MGHNDYGRGYSGPARRHWVGGEDGDVERTIPGVDDCEAPAPRRNYQLRSRAPQQPARAPEAPLVDLSPMPFGKHKGKPLQDVPASYLLWLWDNGVKNEPWKPLHKYIKVSWDALLKDCPDYIP